MKLKVEKLMVPEKLSAHDFFELKHEIAKQLSVIL